jgi:hypothetical protein
VKEVKESIPSFDEPTTLTRREFTADAVLALLMGCVITVSSACDDDTPTNPPISSDVNGVISANHGHTATIQAAQINGGAAIVGMNIQGTAPHLHTISVSQAEIQTLANRQPVTVTSTTDNGHNHTVTFTPM